MVKIDLITGFLGSGKTTFLKRYAEYFIRQGCNIGILENDYGAVNVDMMLLQELAGEHCELEMISGGCDKETHRRRFRTKLIAMGMCGYDRVLVEPSGVFDMDEFFDILRDEPLDRWYEIGSVITVVDAAIERNLSEDASYVLASEAACAGKIVISHVDMASDEQIKGIPLFINQALAGIRCKRVLPDKDFFTQGVFALVDKDFDKLASCGYVTAVYEKKYEIGQQGFESEYFMNVNLSEDAFKQAAKEIMQDQTCGKVFRIKGFLKKADGTFLELNATKSGISVSEIAQGQEVMIVIGDKLNRERMESYVNLHS